MSATHLGIAAVLLIAGTGAALGGATLRTLRGLRREVAGLRAALPADPAAGVPAPREVPVAEIRAAVAEALAEERERELAEARAFWAEQEAREDADAPFFGAAGSFDGPVFIPGQTDLAALAGMEPLLDPEPFAEVPEGTDEATAESAELAAARRRHPSHPDFKPHGAPAIADHERTMNRLEDLSALHTPLVDVRPGPLGTLDVYVFADGTTLCLSPGHRDTAEKLSQALNEGAMPVLLGGSAVSGAFALTFACGEESVYVLADRVIASL
ncbi:hypothetical protein SRB5_68000 [Streptomyces sp. RB5]|uniref:Secreted protein n=1 Tax=Streptomyces smaragdinus TaxID=2585196 RepID=A0A7K0CT35_9ACTN|nr:hypothetical protein [Streptomyces smaragdinus]MQY16598.1 hypothetical protein [Streptomyces smaragdinus]